MQQKRSQNSGSIIDMKHYTVEITNEALADMEQLYNHIAYVLQAPENAMDGGGGGGAGGAGCGREENIGYFG